MKNGKTILTAAEFNDELRNILYKSDRDPSSMGLDLSTGRVCCESYDMTHIIVIHFDP